MATPLGDFFRHNLWANLRLIDALAALDAVHLADSAAGTYGSIHATLVHMAVAEERYLSRLVGEPRGESWHEAATPDLATLRAHLETSGTAFIAYAEGFTPGGTLAIDYDGPILTIPTTILLIQAINHATEHRTNITTILAQHNLPSPELDGWMYGDPRVGE